MQLILFNLWGKPIKFDQIPYARKYFLNFRRLFHHVYVYPHQMVLNLLIDLNIWKFDLEIVIMITLIYNNVGIPINNVFLV